MKEVKKNLQQTEHMCAICTILYTLGEFEINLFLVTVLASTLQHEAITKHSKNCGNHQILMCFPNTTYKSMRKEGNFKFSWLWSPLWAIQTLSQLCPKSNPLSRSLEGTLREQGELKKSFQERHL